MTAGTGIPGLGGQPVVVVDLAAVRALYVETEDCVDWTCDPWDAATWIPSLVDEIERLRAFVDRLISFDDPDPASDGFRARRVASMTRIIDEARAARGEVR